MALYAPYATKADLAAFLYTNEAALPADVEKLLQRASELVKQAVRNNLISTNAEHIEAAKYATCAQVEYWMEAGESVSIVGGIKQYSIGDLSVDYGESVTKGSEAYQMCIRTRNFLNEQGLLYRGGNCSYRESEQV